MSAINLGNTARFKDNERGSVMMLFGLMLPVMLFTAGVGVDMARVTDSRTRIAEASDAAALAAGRALLDGTMTDLEIQSLAANVFDTNIKSRNGNAKINGVDIQVSRATGIVNIKVDSEVPMTLTAIAGFDKVNLPVNTETVFGSRDLEIGMALDITGSMGDTPSGGGQRKIDALKGAFELFAEKLMPDTPLAGQRVRIGLAPFSASVNLGSFAAVATGGRSTDGCVTERMGTYKYTDASPAAGVFKVRADGASDIDPTEGLAYNPYLCPTARLVPLSDDRDALIAKVRAFSPNGYTAGHLGAQWGWNLISDNWGGVWGGVSQPDPYSRVEEGKLIKAVVLMTDGIFNTAYHNANAADQAIRTCNNMKAKGVWVFAVAFDAPAAAQTTLKACASDGADFYADASNGDELTAAFAKFAGKLSELHISK